MLDGKYSQRESSCSLANSNPTRLPAFAKIWLADKWQMSLDVRGSQASVFWKSFESFIKVFSSVRRAKSEGKVHKTGTSWYLNTVLSLEKHPSTHTHTHKVFTLYNVVVDEICKQVYGDIFSRPRVYILNLKVTPAGSELYLEVCVLRCRCESKIDFPSRGGFHKGQSTAHVRFLLYARFMVLSMRLCLAVVKFIPVNKIMRHNSSCQRLFFLFFSLSF